MIVLEFLLFLLHLCPCRTRVTTVGEMVVLGSFLPRQPISLFPRLEYMLIGFLTISTELISSYYFEVVLLCEQFLIGFEGTLGITFIFLCKSKIAKIPSNVLLSMHVFLNSIDIEKSINTHMINAWIIS